MYLSGGIGMLLVGLVAIGYTGTDASTAGCPLIICAPESVNCPYIRYPTYFADIRARQRGVCRGCDVCIKQGTPEDSEGCPLLACSGKLAPGSCYLPENYNSWVQYKARRCPTCEASMCSFPRA